MTTTTLADAQLRRDQVKVRIAEQEEINRRMKEKLARKNTELSQAENEEDEEIKKMDLKLLENEKSTFRLNKSMDEQLEYSAIVGSLLSKGLKVDYKEVPGSCLCPEQKVCASSTGEKIQCNFWTCPAINTFMDQTDITMATLNKTTKH